MQAGAAFCQEPGAEGSCPCRGGGSARAVGMEELDRPVAFSEVSPQDADAAQLQGGPTPVPASQRGSGLKGIF